MTYRRWIGACAIVGVLVITPIAAHADRLDCGIGTTSGMRACATPVGCIARADCFTGPGTEDRTCQAVSVGTTSRECIPQCSTMFSCGGAGDCPMMNGLVGTCANTMTAPQTCTWITTSPTVPNYQQISYCTTPGLHIQDVSIANCHRLPGSSEYTSDYFAGDCDMDGCANGFDTEPCHNDPTPACIPSSGTPAESPFCAPLPAVACSFTSAGVLACGDARPCDSAAASLLPCAFGACESGWSDVARCRPPCSDLFFCALGASYPEQCPPIGTASGTCRPLPAGITGPPRRDGVCVYPSFVDTSCTATDITLACFQTAGSGGLTDNFFAGDCDGDGAPNGCDTRICLSGGGTSTCGVVPGAGCTPTYTPPPDAGLDAGHDGGASPGDAGDDASTSATDAGANARHDASNGIDGGVSEPSFGFGGGGGCRCAVGTRAAPLGAILLSLALAMVIARRSR